MKDFWTRRRNKRIAASALAVVLAGFLVWGIFPWQAAAAENTVADDITINNWHDSNALDDSTKNVGRIWTDKSVSTEDVTLTNQGQTETKTIQKNTDSDFLVGLSALSSTAKIIGESSIPLDIVLVLDVSGSMDESSGNYEAVYDLNTSKTYYVQVNGQYTKVQYRNNQGPGNAGWYYGNGKNRVSVIPKTSADDTASDHVQFYSLSTKMDLLKSAVNGFVDKTAEENDKKSDVSMQSRISLVKFAGDKTDAIGNDTYSEGWNRYNYTQIVSGYQAYTGKNKDTLKGTVNALNPAGATSADYGMQYAKKLVDQSKTDAENPDSNRKNVKRIVIFFTDGEPNHGSGFSDTVAENAIIAAGNIKSEAEIYTIGVFNNADASITGHSGFGEWTDKEKFNAYMHGMSSNYPNAKDYDNLGDRVNGSDGKPAQFYKAATDASELNNIFDEIAEEIVADAQSPTQVDQGEKPSESGYITFTDQLGDYMQVNDMNTLVYANQIYDKPKKIETSTDTKKTISYTYEAEIPDTNHVYPEGNLKDITITVEQAVGEGSLQKGDLVTVKIPANLIPLRYYEITEDGKMTIDETYPMRLFYDVSLKDGVEDKIENPDAALKAYMDANKDDQGQVHFYSNAYDKDSKEASAGIGAYSHFVPAVTNDFYYFQNDEVLYLDEACKTPATSAIDTSGKTIYYYQRDYYKLGSDGKAVTEKNTVRIPGNSNTLLEGFALINEATGEYYIPAGTPRTTSLTYFTEDKAEGANKTGTAKTSIQPVWEKGTDDEEFRGKSVTTYLGNNGRMTFDLPGELDITKTVNVAEGHVVPDSMKDQEFTYKLELTAKDDAQLKESYTAQKYTGAKAEGDSFKIKPGDSFQLKNDQTLKIYGLAAGTKYTVTETKADHYTMTVAQNNAGDNAATGTADNGNVFAKGSITGNDTAVVNYTNTYKAVPGTLDGSATLKVSKDFQLADGSSAWSMEYLQNSRFTFYLTADSENAPMPENAAEIAGMRVASITADKDNISGAFENITYTEPGTYHYRITEKDPGSERTRGVSYSYAAYTVTVTVTDNAGRLEADAVMKQMRNDQGTELANPQIISNHTAVFKNVYDADSETVTVMAEKEFTDHTGNKALQDGDYKFRITPVTKGAPLPEGDGEVSETENTGIGVKFKSITFTAKDAAGATKNTPKLYEYTLEEVLPDEATASNQYTVAGVTYDPTIYKIQLAVYIDTVNGKDTVIVDRTYMDAEGNPLTGVPVFHNSYRAAEVTLSGNTALKGEKTLTGRDMKDGESFDFTLEAADSNTSKAITDGEIKIATNGGKASVSGGKNGTAEPFNFGNVTFTKVGRYTFAVKETVPDPQAGGVTYDRHTTTVTVVVTDDTEHPGKLKADVSYNNGSVSDVSDRAVFRNSYEASFLYSTTGGLRVEKVLNGRTMKAGEFAFTITPQGNTPAVGDADKSFNNTEQRASGAADSMQKLLGLTFTQNDIGKTFTYLVKETIGDTSGITYDQTQYKVEIIPVDNGDGTLHTVTNITPQTLNENGDFTDGQTVTYDSSTSSAIPALRFTNSYEAAITDPVNLSTDFTKVLTGRDWTENDSFTFKLSNVQKPEGVTEAPMPQNETVTVKKADVKDGKAAIDFGSITFAKAGIYKYKIVEDIPNTVVDGMNYDDIPRVITVTVTDDGSGKLTAVVTGVEGSRTFTNKYETEDLPLSDVCSIAVTKTLHGHDMAEDQFEFSIKAEDKASADKLKIAEDNGATFKSIAATDGETATLLDSLQLVMKQEDIGKTYSYTFAETQGDAAGYRYDDNTYKLDITTNDAGDGTLTATVVLTNTKTNTKVFEKTVSQNDQALGEQGIEIPFVNYYDGSTDVNGGTKASVSASKTLNNRKLKADEFTFKLATKPVNGEGRVLQTKTNNANGTISFDELSYGTSEQAAGSGTMLSDAVKDGYATKSVNNQGKTVYTLNYQVYEDTTSLPADGVSPTTSSFGFTVTVTDNGNGTLTAVTNYQQDKNKFEFVNTYSTGEDIPVTISGSKTLNHGAGLIPADITGKFTFTLTAVTGGAPMPTKETANNDENGNITFGNITYKLSDLEGVETAGDGSRTKTFEYKVTESGSVAGITNDSVKSKTFKVTLTDDGKGKLTAVCDPKEGPQFNFTNTYNVADLPSSVTDQVKINKELTGRDLKKGEFHFELLEDGKVAAKGTNNADGTVTFDEIRYTRPGTYTYTVREVNNGAGGVTYDDSQFMIHTQITDQGDGTLKAEHQVVVLKDNEFAPVESNAITFHNKYEAKGTTASIGAVKRLTGKELKDGQFTFQLKDESGRVIDEAKNDKTGAVSFKALELDKAGTYHYTVCEVNDKQDGIKYDSGEKSVTITVKDSTEGYLQAQVKSDGELIFTNAYEASGGDGGSGIFGKGTKTGDYFPIIICILLLMAAGSAGTALLIGRKRS